MREIKFRAWDRNYSCIYDWGEICIESAQIFITDGDLRYSSKDESLVLMQYTGLKDKNGKEVYEGDVIKNLDTDIYHYELGTVGFEYGGFVMKGYYPKFDPESEMSCDLESFTYLGDGSSRRHREHIPCLEVVGNIYQNPELIEVKE